MSLKWWDRGPHVRTKSDSVSGSDSTMEISVVGPLLFTEGNQCSNIPLLILTGFRYKTGITRRSNSLSFSFGTTSFGPSLSTCLSQIQRPDGPEGSRSRSHRERSLVNVLCYIREGKGKSIPPRTGVDTSVSSGLVTRVT